MRAWPGTNPPISTHGKHLYYLTNDDSEFMRLKRYELASGKHEEVEKAAWDILFTHFSPNGKNRVTGYNEDEREAIKVIDTASRKPIPMPDLRAFGLGERGGPSGGPDRRCHRLARRDEDGLLRKRRPLAE